MKIELNRNDLYKEKIKLKVENITIYDFRSLSMRLVNTCSLIIFKDGSETKTLKCQ